MIIDVTDSTFDGLYSLSMNALVLLDIYSDWCAPCKEVARELEIFSRSRYAELHRVQCAKMNVSDAPKAVADMDILSIPTILIFYKGTVRMQHTGSVSADALRNLVSDVVDIVD